MKSDKRMKDLKGKVKGKMEKRFMKRLGCLAIAGVMALGVAAVAPTKAQAATGDNPSSAQYLKLNQAVGSTVMTDHKYYYRVTTSNVPGTTYKLYLDCDSEEGIAYADFIDGNYEDLVCIGAAMGDPDMIELTTLKPGTNYYIGMWTWNESVDYSVKLKAITAKSGIKSLKAGKKKLTVKYKSMRNATRYQIQYKRSGKKWSSAKSVYTTNVEKTIKKLSTGKKYNVRVRAQRKAGGKWYSGKWSATKTVKVK